jgi:glutathione synthase
VADDLRQFGIYMIGLDFIGDKITEVNITSPTALPLINKLMNIQGHIVLVDEMEKLRLQVRSSCD